MSQNSALALVFLALIVILSVACGDVPSSPSRINKPSPIERPAVETDAAPVEILC